MAWVSSSQPLHEPASTWRIAGERPEGLGIAPPGTRSHGGRGASGCGARTGLGRRERRADLPWRKLLYERPYEAHRFEQLVETHRDPRRHVAARVRGHARIELLVRRNRVIDAQVVLHPARSAGESREAHASGELRQYLPGHDEAVLRARVLVVDRPERGDLAPDRLQALEQN